MTECTPENACASLTGDDGICPSYKELATGLGVGGCIGTAAADSTCVGSMISYGKVGGSREGRCLCDTVADCSSSLMGTDLGSDGYDR